MTSSMRRSKSQETCPNVPQLLNAREKVFRPQGIFALQRSRRYLSLFRKGRG
jgi:hypothetical protein